MNDKLVEQLRDEDSYYRVQEKHWCIDAEELERQRQAAADRIETLQAIEEAQNENVASLLDRIEAQAAEIEAYRRSLYLKQTLISDQAAEIETMVPRDVAETWKAKAENLSAALKATAASNAEYLKTVVGLKEEIERLREAGNDLGFYAGHEDACDCVKGWAKGPCNCGYTEAWQAWHSLAGKAEQ